MGHLGGLEAVHKFSRIRAGRKLGPWGPGHEHPCSLIVERRKCKCKLSSIPVSFFQMGTAAGEEMLQLFLPVKFFFSIKF